jgi:hypothetical protein
VRVDRRKLGVQTIKKVGRYTVPVGIFGDVVAELRLAVVPEGGELPSEEELAAAETVEADGATEETAEAAVADENVPAWDDEVAADSGDDDEA